MKIPSQIIIIFLISIFYISCENKKEKSINENYNDFLKKTNWIIESNNILGLNKSEKLFILKHKNDSIQIWNFKTVEFSENATFKSYDSWECGNDCFTKTYGKYKFIENSRIELQIDSIAHSGTCEAPTEYMGKDFINFNIEKNNDKIVLTKN